MMTEASTSTHTNFDSGVVMLQDTETDSHNDSDLENCSENAPVQLEPHKNAGLNDNNSYREGNVLGTSRRTNYNDNDESSGEKHSKSMAGNKPSSPVVILPQTDKEDQNEISETEALSETEGPEDEASTTQESNIRQVQTASTNESLESDEEAYRNDCKDYLLQLTNTTGATILAESNNKDQDEDELSIANAPSDEQAYLAKDVMIVESTNTVSTIEFSENYEEDERPVQIFGKRSSFGSRYKSGLITGLSLESKSGTFPKPQVEKPPRASLGGRASYIMQSPESISTTNTSNLASPRVSSPNLNTRNLLKMYNKDLYYSNELSYLLGVDPSRSSSGRGVNFEEVTKIVATHPSVCRIKYDLPFDGRKISLYPLFTLVAHGAPRELVETVFTQNPFMFLDVRDLQGQTIMHYALRYTPPSIETLNYLAHRSPHSLDAWDHQKRSPLHTVCAHNAAATEIVQFIVNESPKHVLAVPDTAGNLPLHLCLNSMECSYAIIKDLTDRYPESVASRTAANQLPLQLAQKQTLRDDIQGYILERTPVCDVTVESFSVALRTAKYSSALLLIQRLVEEDPSILTKLDNGKIPLEIAHAHGASKAVMQYMYQKTPNHMIPKWLAKIRPTEKEVRQALKTEAEEKAKTQQPVATDGAVDMGTDNSKSASIKSEKAIDNVSDILVPTPSFWERLCCKPRIVLE